MQACKERLLLCVGPQSGDVVVGREYTYVNWASASIEERQAF